MIIRKATKKPVTIETVELTDSNAGSIVTWITRQGHRAIMRGGPGGGSKNATIIIKTLEGDHLALVGDWIIKGVAGEFYPCKPDIFEMTYDLQSINGGE
jgi:hypothetical protein